MTLAEKWSKLKQKKIDRKDVIIVILVFCILAILFFAWYYLIEKKNPFNNKEFDSEAAYQYLFSIYEPERLQRPLGVAVTSNGDVIVTDSIQNRLVVFDRNGKFKKYLGKTGKGPGQYNYPISIAVSGNKIYVADLHNQRVQVIDFNGNQLSVIPSARDRQKVGSTIMPSTIAVDKQGNVYVSDLSYQRILEFDSTGAYIRTFGKAGSGQGELSYVNGIAVDDSDGGKIYIANSNNSRLDVFSAEGKFLNTLDVSKNLTNPRGIAFNPFNNRVYVADTLAHRVVGIAKNGGVMEALGSRGNGSDSFNFPNAVAIDDEGRLYVADRENNRVVVYAHAK